jgi:outer membrane protein OmpU
MNNLKKIGLSALAGSLVATSAFAGAVSVSGGASMNVEHTNGGAENAGKTFSMGNQLTFTGGGELDNGLNVSISFIIDEFNGDTANTAGPADGSIFDNHSVSVGNDMFGTLTLHGEGGSSAQKAIDTTAAGDIWDDFDGADNTVRTSASGNNLLSYKLPALVDGVAITASYLAAGSGTTSSTAFGVSYTGIEGLTVNAARGEGNTPGVTIEATTYHINYAYGPVTVGYSKNDYDHTTPSSDQETTSWKVSYTVSDELSISYGAEEIDQTGDVEKAEYSSISASYTAGGMTISAARQTGDNIDGSATATKDQERWALGASFAF